MDDLSGPRILDRLASTRFRHVEVHASVDSTQTLLVAEGGRDGRVVVADHQTAGRGRAGRSWTDVPGAMLMFSVLLRKIAPAEAAKVGLAGGVAVARAIRALVGPRAFLKWPNDVRVDGRKICGMLGELAPGGDFVVLGIGVNVRHEHGDLPDELGATSLRMEGAPDVRRDDLCASILRELDNVFTVGDFIDDYRELSETIGSRVRVELADGVLEGVADGVRDDGALLVDGRAVVTGDVVHVR